MICKYKKERHFFITINSLRIDFNLKGVNLSLETNRILYNKWNVCDCIIINCYIRKT
ncbi:conserved domain protein (plasmid) [Bacillus anthracis str. A0488]|uniref:Conserved domain protein n=1 Tax=Bacillus anthracis TaxID=1392 RepID=Q6F033_BACAN|nr:hypothetical protein BX_B0067 [Bacillus anthracis str. A2012]AAT28997.2 conserved domain protein [Bacillus anthracis str. 'Ames Ancestor']ADK08309.1 conserved hypothetical protein [Bacillus cereus biovar anthracis str. CI]EDR16234.1 conserved domain protein [Bacillus anthracis str. A0488]EDR85113.1 conserved domain protein [Bacillus anthracis str. A0193]EDR90470.1 conserved domain protein [Bacillus anthracis str. A0442]EDS94357.1 conserved domain protein [Bacillus anthracis str. A0389]EDT